jgi:hypothetical protein
MKLKLGLPALLVAAALIQVPAQAGNTKCDISKEGAPCSMKSCAHLAKKQAWCSPKCHKDCCFCPREGRNSCNGHNPERQQSPEEE